MGEKLQAAKEQMLSIPTVVAIISGVLAAGGGHLALKENNKAHEEADKLMVYRVEQLEGKLKESKEVELDKRLTRLEDAQRQMTETQKAQAEATTKLAALVEKLDRIVSRLTERR